MGHGLTNMLSKCIACSTCAATWRICKGMWVLVNENLQLLKHHKSNSSDGLPRVPVGHTNGVFRFIILCPVWMYGV